MNTKKTGINLGPLERAFMWFMEEGLPGLVAVCFIGGVLMGAFQLLSVLAERQESVVSKIDVGNLVKAESVLSDWSGDSMRVETTNGFFTVRGTMEIIKDQPFVHEVRRSGDALLCQGSPKRCLHVLRSGVQ